MDTDDAVTSTVTAHAMLPDVLGVHPELRPVFDRYGLRGCGGPLGPAESVEYFAKAHGVAVDRLVGELNAALADPSLLPPAPAAATPHAMDQLADAIYQRFFKAALVVVLTVGAAWGALLLLRIGIARNFTALSIHDINAHGHAQIFGWVGLFVMGFAYQAFPRIKHTDLWRPDLANMTFYLMVFGVFARAIGEPLFAWPFLRELAITGGFAEVAAIGLFIAILLKTFQQSGKPYERHDAYILAALAFFLVQAVYALGLLHATTAVESREALLGVIATYQAPLRDLQIHGFAMLMILGVGIRMFPALFGFAAPGPRLVRRCLALLVLGVLGETGFFILWRVTGAVPWVIAMYAAVFAVAGASVALTLRWGLLARPAEPDRSTKFIRVAVAWLHTSMLLLVLVPLYNQVILPGTAALTESGREAAAIGFSHAYYGSVRHAITVGFISFMILGMAAKIVPTLKGVDVRRLRPLWIPFVLVNVGCGMRVVFQITTDFTAWAFPVAGVSGLFELTGIAIWGVHIWRIMNGRQPDEAAAQPPSRITADDKIGWIVEWFPQTLPLFLDKGFAPLANPVMRRTMARTISLRTAADHHQLDLDTFLAELNRVAFDEAGGEGTGHSAKRGVSLPVLNHG